MSERQKGNAAKMRRKCGERGMSRMPTTSRYKVVCSIGCYVLNTPEPRKCGTQSCPNIVTSWARGNHVNHIGENVRETHVPEGGKPQYHEVV